MKNPQNSSVSAKMFGFSMVLTVAFSFVVIVATFLLANSELSFDAKALVFLSVVFIYPLVSAFFYFWQRAKLREPLNTKPDSAFDDETDGRLLALEEANEFFGASLKFSDMFRLVASRVAEIVPFSSAVIFLRADGDNVLQIAYAVGENSRSFMNLRADTNRGLAVKSFVSGKVQIDEKLHFERRVFPPELLQKLTSAAAIPLRNRHETYGVLVLYGSGEIRFKENETTLLEAVGERIAPLFANSFAFEQSVSNALTDALTNLPNERGFFLVLENQLAESLRFRDERPLTVLAMDIRNFDEINKRHGHATGDHLLTFAAGVIKKQLRQMDVLTRTSGDEFLAVLPTANEKISEEIVGRIQRAFVLNRFEVSARERINLEINFGAGTFWRDGETGEQLLKTARLRKDQDKSTEKNKVIWFPKEFVN